MSTFGFAGRSGHILRFFPDYVEKRNFVPFYLVDTN
jgi:hypothetical protein